MILYLIRPFPNILWKETIEGKFLSILIIRYSYSLRSSTGSYPIICTSAWNWTCTRIIREGHHGEEGNSFFLLGYTDCHKGQENAKFYFHFASLCLSPKGWLPWVQTPMLEENRGMPIGNTPLLPWKASSMPRTQIPVRWVKTWWKIYHQVFPLSLSDDIFLNQILTNQTSAHVCTHVAILATFLIFLICISLHKMAHDQFDRFEVENLEVTVLLWLALK